MHNIKLNDKHINLFKNCEHGYDKNNPSCYHREGSVWNHVVAVVNEASKDNDKPEFFRNIAWLHDLGKPLAKTYNHEKKHATFYGHEGLSFYIANSYTRNTCILKTVAMHGDLWRYNRPWGEKDLTQKKNIEKFSIYDRRGSISDHSHTLNQSKIRNALEYVEFNASNPTTTILVGPPCSGKSTFVQNNNFDVVISFDEQIMKLPGETYNDKFKYMEDNKTNTCGIMDSLVRTYNKAVKEDKNIVVDMTNMNEKSRRRWLNNRRNKRNYTAVVFYRSFDDILESSAKRSTEYGKDIPESVIIDCMKRFQYPIYGEGFNSIQEYFV